MIYDVIILGASFLTSGIINKTNKNYLVIEERLNAGYEFLSALKYEKNDLKPKTKEGILFLEKLKNRQIFNEFGIKLYDTAYLFYESLLGKNVLLGVKIIEIKRENDLFILDTISVSGIKTYKAKKIIDTRVNEEMIKEKWISFILTKMSDEASILIETQDFKVLDSGLPLDKIIKIKLALDDDFIKARRKIYNFTMSDNFKGFRLIYTADYFDYHLKEDYESLKTGIRYIPSVDYFNPVIAYDEGIMIGETL